MLSLGNKLTLNSQPIYKFVNKYSIDFDGSDQCIVTDGADSVLQNTTYSFWCKTSESSSNTVFGHGSVTKGAFSLNYLSDKPLLGFSSNTYVYWQDVTAQDDGEWHHWVVYADATTIGNCKLYIDGVLQTQTNAVNNTGYDAYTESLTIGGDKAVGGNYFEGQIDEFAVYDRELTQDEITRMYNTYYSPNRVANGNFSQIGNEEVTNGDFSQIGGEQANYSDNNIVFTDLSDSTTISLGSNSYRSEAFGNTNDSRPRVTVNGSGIVTGKTYKVVYTPTSFTGSTVFDFFENNTRHINNHNASLPITFYFVASSTYDGFDFDGSQTFRSDYTLSVKEVGQDWTFANDATMGDNVATIIGDGSAAGYIIQDNVFESNKFYKCVFDVTINSGLGLKFQDGLSYSPHNENIGFATTSGVYTFYFNSTSYNQLAIVRRTSGTAYDSIINSVTVKEVGQHWTFTNGWSVDDTKATNSGTGGQIYPTSNSWTSGATIKFQVTVSGRTTGHIRIQNPSVSTYYVNNINTNDSFEYSFTTIDANGWKIEAVSGFDGSIDNIVVQELKHDATNLMLNAGAYQSANPLITSTKSMEFDGTDDYLSIGSDCPTGNFTVTSWVKKTGTGGWYAIFSASTQIWFGLNDNGRILAHVGGPTLSATGVVDINKWHHCTLTWNGTASFIYVDGVQVATSTGTNNPAATPYDIGKLSTSGQNYFDGLITEVGLYDRALTSLEVASLYNQGMPTNLLVNRNNYQSGNPTVFNTKQVDFDGVDDYMIANSTLGSFTGSVSAWVKRESNVGYQYIIDFRKPSGTGYVLLDTGADNILLSSGTTYVDGIAGTTISVGNWHHIVITGMTLNIVSDIVFGARYTFIQPFNGEMSQVGLWNSTLTADEVSSLYNHGLPIDLTTNQAAYESSSNLVGYWRMGSGTLDTYPLIADQTNATLGSELVVNGDFATDSDWTKGAGWTISGGKAVKTSGAGASLSQTLPIAVIGKKYKFTFDANVTSGVANASLYGVTIPNFTTSGSQEHIVTATSTSGFNFYAATSFNGSIDNLSVKQVNGNPAIMTNQTSSDIENGSPYANIVQNINNTPAGESWNASTNWTTAVAGKFSCDGTSNNDLNQGGTDAVVGKSYVLSFEILSINSGNLVMTYGGIISTTRDAIGVYTETITATGTDRIRVRPNTSGTIASVTNITATEVNTGLQGYWKMGDGTNDEYPVIYDQTNPTVGVEEITNGTFTTDSDWNKTQATISGGEARIITTDGSYAAIDQSNVFEVGKTYLYSINVKSISGTMQLRGGSGTDIDITTSGVKTGYIVPTSTGIEIKRKSGAGALDVIIDDVSAKQVQGNPATMTNMVEGNITNQFPLTKIRNYYRMGDGILDGYPIIQDQTSPNLAHIPTTNLVTYSEDFSQSYWTSSTTTYGTIDTVNLVTAPDGTVSAQKWTRTAGTYNLLRPVSNITGTYYAQSVFVKNIDADNFYLRLEKTPEFGYYNFASDTVSDTDIKVEHLANDWIRLSTNVPDNYFKSFGIGENETDSTELNHSVYVWGAQIEAQGQATAYIKSDGIAAVRKATTTNLITYSNSNGLNFTFDNVSMTYNSIVSPDGLTNGILFKQTGSASSNSAYNYSLTTANGTYTYSIFIKAKDSTSVRFYQSGGSAVSQDFNPQTMSAGVLSGGLNLNFEDVGNGWFRVSFTKTLSSAPYHRLQIYPDRNNTQKGVYIFGLQVEAQTQAETYAKTTGLPVTIDLFTENNYGTMTNMSSSDIVEDTP